MSGSAVAHSRKHRLSFNSNKGKSIFGKNFKSGKVFAMQNTAKLLMSNILEKNGAIKKNKISYLEESDLWSYIAYLYYFNKEHVTEFKHMKGNDGRASAERFYDVVRSVSGKTSLTTHKSVEKISINDLHYFINHIISRRAKTLVNPVVEHYNNAILRNDIDTLKNDFIKNMDIVVRTGMKDARIVTDPDEIQNSDIVISIGLKG